MESRERTCEGVVDLGSDVRLWRRPGFFGRERGDVQRVNVRLHHLAQCSIHKLVTLQRAKARKASRYDLHAEMSLAFACAEVTHMTMAIVDELDRGIREVLVDACTDALGTAAHLCGVHAFVELEESAGTLEAIQAPWITANNNVSPIMP